VSDHLAAGVVPLDDGRLLLRGVAAGLCRWLDGELLQMARQAGAQECRFPATVGQETLARADFFASFPGGATALGEAPPRYLLNPAVCYHAYALLADRPLAGRLLLTAAQSCFREGDRGSGSPARLWEFTMREIVFLGPAGWVAEQRDGWAARAEAWAAELGLRGSLAPATDPFFGTAGDSPESVGRGRRLLQQVKGLKLELRLDYAGEPLAAASFNRHETFFGRRFGIAFEGADAHSGCAAFGLERWALAFLAQRGERAASELIGA
jgi:hypothetical protein